MEYLVRLVQLHETFRRPELESLAYLAGVDMEILDYHEDKSPFCRIRLASDEAAASLISRSILAQSIYSFWGSGTDYASLHASVRERTSQQWPAYATASFCFSIDSFRGKRTSSQKRALIDSFSYLSFMGPILMTNAEHQFCILEDFPLRPPNTPQGEPSQVYLGRLIGTSSRAAINTYDLKKRLYISTTSMDAELSLITANMALAAPGKVHYDPFMGTGSFPLACAHFGSCVVGSDIDGRSIRGTGKGDGVSVVGNFKQYGLPARYLDGFVGDLTNTPLRIGRIEAEAKRVTGRWLDGIVCDPPYGVREGLKVLGKTGLGEEGKKAVVLNNGQLAHLADGYVPPKRPYSFTAMLADILAFATVTLVDGGRLCMWMPTANDEDIELAIPGHPALVLVSVCVQEFNKWSRRLLTYQRIPDAEIDWRVLQALGRNEEIQGNTADELNAFRRKYFQGFKDTSASASTGSLASA